MDLYQSAPEMETEATSTSRKVSLGGPTFRKVRRLFIVF